MATARHRTSPAWRRTLARKRLTAEYRHCLRRHRGRQPTRKGQGGKQGSKGQSQKRGDSQYEYRVWGRARNAREAKSEYLTRLREVRAGRRKMEGWAEVQTTDATAKCGELG